jgi:hypothetical protein
MADKFLQETYLFLLLLYNALEGYVWQAVTPVGDGVALASQWSCEPELV